jgi:hypothetical protein
MLYKTEEMHKRVADMYSHIFIFLEDTMEWYQKKSRHRTLDAFRGKFYDEFEQQIAKIVEMSAGIKRQAGLGTMGELRETRYASQNTEVIVRHMIPEMVDVRIGQEGMIRKQAEMDYTLKQIACQLEEDQQRKEQLTLEEPRRLEALANSIGVQLIVITSAKHVLEENAKEYFDEEESHRSKLKCKLKQFRVIETKKGIACRSLAILLAMLDRAF